MTIRRFFLVFVGCLALHSAVQAQLATTNGPILPYQAPVGWKIIMLAKIPNPIAVDTSTKGFHPYIQIDRIPSTTPFSDFTTANKATMKKMVPSTQFIDERIFITDAGKQGTRITVTAHVGENDLKSIYYLFEGSNNFKYSVLANCSAQLFDKYEPVFDTAIKTFAFP